MKQSLLTILRDKTTEVAQFRAITEQLASLLASEAASLLLEEKISIQTPISKCKGSKVVTYPVVIPILTAGLALLPAFLHLFPNAQVGFFGIRRDEKTAEPCPYYENLPSLSSHDPIFLLDPMIATGGSSIYAINRLKEKGAALENINLIGIIAAEYGIEKIHSHFQEVKIKVVTVDPSLNAQKFIVPGLGDFGDRYFGT